MILTHSCLTSGIIIVVADTPIQAFSRLVDLRGISAADDLPLSLLVVSATSSELMGWRAQDYPNHALEQWMANALILRD